MIREDLSQIYSLTPGPKWARVIKMFLAPGVQATIVYRFARWVSLRPRLARIFLAPFSFFAQLGINVMWGIDIGPGATIGKGLRIVHYGGIFIGSRVIIGDNLFLSHDVTIGLAGTGANRGAPTIGDNVYVAPGAKIAGKIHIGNNVKIGANAVIERDVPDNALVQVASPRIVVFPAYGGFNTTKSPAPE